MFNSLIIILTRKCNKNCSYCNVLKKDENNIWNNISDKKLLEYVKKIIKFVELNKLDGIRFFGWEVFLQKELLKKFINILRKNWFQKDIYVNTNLLLFEKEDILWIRKYNVKIITSLNWGKKIHCKTRLISFQEYEILLNNIKNLIDNWVFMQINMVLFPFDYSILDEFKYIISLAPKKINLLPLAYSGLLEKYDLYKYKLNLFKLYLYIKVYNYENNILFYDSKRKNLYTWQRFFPLFTNDPLLDIDGNLYYSMAVMEKFFDDKRKKLLVGNINVINNMKISYKKKYGEVIEDTLKQLWKKYILTIKINKFISLVNLIINV